MNDKKVTKVTIMNDKKGHNYERQKVTIMNDTKVTIMNDKKGHNYERQKGHN